jgi:hypothetical protein
MCLALAELSIILCAEKPEGNVSPALSSCGGIAGLLFLGCVVNAKKKMHPNAIIITARERIENRDIIKYFLNEEL